ncbi:MAG: hypothetical protein QME64_06555 [bacterium]|nr:hypothetical protein [bacterium]
MSSLFLTLLIVTNIGLGGTPATQADTLAEWTTLNHINVARGFAGAFIWNNYLYLVGGQYDTGRIIERAQIYPDGNLGPWTIDTPFTYDHSNFARIALVNGYIYASKEYPYPEYGPINPDGTVGPFTPFSLDTDRPYGTSLVGYQSPSTGEGYLYLLGGKDGMGTPILPSVLRNRILPDGSLEGWTAISSLPIPGDANPALIYNHRIYTFGGAYRMTNLTPVGTLGEWTTLVLTPSLPGSVLGAVGVNNNLYLGVYKDNTSSYICQVPLDAQGRFSTWTTLATYPRLTMALATWNNYIYFIGGWQYFEDHWPYSVYFDNVDRVMVIQSTEVEPNIWEIYR